MSLLKKNVSALASLKTTLETLENGKFGLIDVSAA
jgi:hypothetical protein